MKLKKIKPCHIIGRTYDWSAVNDVIDGRRESVRYECGDEVMKAYVSLRSSMPHRKGMIHVKMDGSSVIVTR